MKDATLAQGNQVLNLILQKQISGEQLQQLVESGLFSDLLEANIEKVDRNEFRRMIGLKPLNIFAVKVNYDLPVEEAVKAGGYDWVNSDIVSEHFLGTEAGEKEISIELVHFGRCMETGEVCAELDKRGLRPATLKELLALGGKFPGLQKKFPIIAFGSVWRSRLGYRRCAYLDRSGSERYLDLCWLAGGWHENCRFVAVRK